MNTQIWFNGKIVKEDDYKIPFLTHGLHYGSGVFEGIRVYNEAIFQLEEHIKRLLESARLMDMKSPFTLEELCEASREIVADQKVSSGYIRPLIWRTHANGKVLICQPDSGIEAAIAAWEIPTSMISKEAFLNKEATSLSVSKWKRPPPECAPFAAKASGLYVIATLAAHEARTQGFKDALMLSSDDFIAEATSSNIFFVVKGEIHTPKPDSFLNGITRQTVIKLAKKLNIPVHERKIDKGIISEADEVFLTGTASEITPVSKIDNHIYLKKEVTRTIMSEFYDFVFSHEESHSRP